MEIRKTITYLFLASSLTALPACSALFTQAPSGPSDEYSACTESYVAPVLDTIVAALYAGFGAALLLGNSTRPEQIDNRDRRIWGGIQVGMGLGLGASAAYGYHTVDSCREHNKRVLLLRSEKP